MKYFKNFGELRKGTIYHREYDKYSYIFEYKEANKHQGSISGANAFYNRDFNSFGTVSAGFTTIGNTRYATEFEIEWFKMCKKAGKFVTRPVNLYEVY